MSSSVLTRGHLSLRYALLNSKPFKNNSTIRSASLNSAIGRGLRRSQGVGFRGKERHNEAFGERTSDRFRDGERETVRRTSETRPDLPTSRLSRGGWRDSDKNDDYKPRTRETAGESDSRPFRKQTSFGDDSKPSGPTRYAESRDLDSRYGKGSYNKPTADRPSSTRFESSRGPDRPGLSDKARRSAESDRMAMQRNPDGMKRISTSRLAFLERDKHGQGGEDRKFASSRQGGYDERPNPSSTYSKDTSSDGYKRHNTEDRKFSPRQGGYADERPNSGSAYSKDASSDGYKRHGTEDRKFASPRRGDYDEKPHFRSNYSKDTSSDGYKRHGTEDRKSASPRQGGYDERPNPRSAYSKDTSSDGYKPHGTEDRKFASPRQSGFDERPNSRPNYSRDTSGDGYKRSDLGDRQSRGAQDYKRKESKYPGNDDRRSENKFGRTETHSSTAYGSRNQEMSGEERPKFQESADRRIPLSIPYTTPASEFLYGTSVVEAALSSATGVPRRKLYKLYIYAGENRENEAKDAAIERLAGKVGLEVVHVNSDWLRLMDKMSGGRPHNGYILEASPLPKVPVISLGPMASQDSIGLYPKNGFSIALDYQSREEAAINGTSSFVEMTPDPSGRKPLVLLLDSIQDPGNLGGIIRSASFLGVTAIAISTRNSASFTPVVMKASAGAMEQVNILSVKNPGAFLENSKTAGWKVYAAVAPSPHKKPSDPRSTATTDQIFDPLLKDPCILMLGNEGEGLRWNLRSKADCDISIAGSGHPSSVDSLNVSVAAGILCNNFFRHRNVGGTPEKNLETLVRPKRDLF